jgi:hypothetical protein
MADQTTDPNTTIAQAAAAAAAASSTTASASAQSAASSAASANLNATNAGASARDAANAAAVLQSVVSTLNSLWLGDLTVAPTTGAGGGALNIGAQYRDISQSPPVLMVYTGTNGWQPELDGAAAAQLAALESAEAAAGSAASAQAAAKSAGAASAASDNAAASATGAAQTLAQTKQVLNQSTSVIASAQAWATSMTEVGGVDYSAKYYATQASNFAANAQTHLNNASQYAANANNSASMAGNSATAAINAAAAAAKSANLVSGFVTGSELPISTLQDDDTVAVVREGVLFTTKYSTFADAIRTGVLEASNNLSDIADPVKALNNIGAAPQAGFLSQLVTASSTSSLAVSTTFSFTPVVDGKIAVIAQGGAYGYSTGSITHDFSTINGATSLGSQGNTASGNLAITSGQFGVTAGTPVTITLTQTAPTGTTTNQLSSLFAFLPN